MRRKSRKPMDRLNLIARLPNTAEKANLLYDELIRPVEIVHESVAPDSFQDTIVEVHRRIEKVHEEYFSDRKMLDPSRGELLKTKQGGV